MKFIRRHQRILSLGAVGLFFALMVAAAYGWITNRRIDLVVNLDSPALPEYPHSLHEPLSFKVAVAPMLSAVKSFDAYHGVAELMAREFQMPLELVTRDSYHEVAEMLKNSEVDVAFVSLGGYIMERDSMDVIATALVRGRPEYYAYVIVPADSPAQGLNDLTGKSFLFTDPESITGHWFVTDLLRRRGTEAGQFFSASRFTASHDRSLLAVSQHMADGAAVSSIVYELMLNQDPALAQRLRITDRSAPFPGPPVVVRKTMPVLHRHRLVQVLEAAARNPEGRALLARIGIDGFRGTDNSFYDAALAEEIIP